MEEIKHLYNFCFRLKFSHMHWLSETYTTGRLAKAYKKCISQKQKICPSKMCTKLRKFENSNNCLKKAIPCQNRVVNGYLQRSLLIDYFFYLERFLRSLLKFKK